MTLKTVCVGCGRETPLHDEGCAVRDVRVVDVGAGASNGYDLRYLGERSEVRLDAAAEREAFYDREIAPRLAELGVLAANHGLTFLAAVEFDADAHSIGKTWCQAPGSSLTMRFAELMIRVSGGAGLSALERFMMAAARAIAGGRR